MNFLSSKHFNYKIVIITTRYIILIYIYYYIVTFLIFQYLKQKIIFFINLPGNGFLTYFRKNQLEMGQKAGSPGISNKKNQGTFPWFFLEKSRDRRYRLITSQEELNRSSSNWAFFLLFSFQRTCRVKLAA